MRLFYAALAATCLLAATPASALDLELVNNSKTVIAHLYMSPPGQRSWGDDQLGDGDSDTVEPGDSYTLTDIEPGSYDLRLVAEDGTECIIPNVRFGTSKEWTVTEAILDSCHNK